MCPRILFRSDLKAQILCVAYPPAHYQGLVVIRLPDDAIAKKILSLLERFLKQTELVAQLPGHIVILEKGRVRFRPALV